jgi:two-component system, OmpR family, sensor kinase
MRSLFVRIFVTIWLAAAVVAVAFAWIQIASIPRRVFTERRTQILTEVMKLGGESAAERASRGREADAELERLGRVVESNLYLFDGRARPVAPSDPPADARAIAREVVESGRDVRRDDETNRHIGLLLRTEGPEGRYAIVGRRPPHVSPWERFFSADTLPLRVLVIVLVAGLVSFPLARYLTKPIQHIRAAAQRVAAGDLSVRVQPQVGRRHDEVGMLAQDFDRMAERLGALVSAQGQLLRDVSHELRSPLARLSVGLELARKSAGPDAKAGLDRMEREVERLNTLIGEVLAISRLESRETIEREEIDLGSLVEEIVRDADFEAQSSNRSVALVKTSPARMRGDEEILRRAIENVVRNAVRFTEEKTRVEVTMAKTENGKGPIIRIAVRDRGPGVPEDALENIFEPFYRVGTARDRKTGGTGVGLAITDRAVRAHGGHVAAKNVSGGGLEVTLELPA